MRPGALPAWRCPVGRARHREARVQPPRARSRTPGRPLAWQLGLLCGILLVPVLALEAYLLIRMAAVERNRHEAVAREAVKGIAISLDRGLSTLGAVAEVLATSDHLVTGDVEAFRQRLHRVPPVAVAEIVLRGGGGAVLMSSGATPPAAHDAAAEAAARATGRAQVSGLLPGGDGGGGDGRRSTFAIVVPVRDAELSRGRVLSLRVPIGELEQLLERQALPGGMAASLTDREGRLMAGTPGAPDPLRALRGTMPGDAAEGWRHGTDASGRPIVLAFARSEVAGWTAWVSMPEARFAAPLHRSLVASVLTAGLFALLAAVLAVSFARWITRPISALAAAAARGEEAPAATPVREVNALSEAYAAARTEAQRLREMQAELRQVARLN